MIFGQNLVTYRVFYEESESEVKRCQILQPGGKKIRKTNVKLNFSIFFLICLFLNLNVWLNSRIIGWSARIYQESGFSVAPGSGEK